MVMMDLLCLSMECCNSSSISRKLLRMIFFAFGHVQGFVYFVGKESVFFHFAR